MKVMCGFCLFAISLLTARPMLAERLDSEMQLQLYEADEELEKVEQSALSQVFMAFRAKGGTLFRLSTAEDAFALLPGDLVFPSCSGGHNRSQTLWNILRPFADKINLQRPHATRYGFDPYDGQPNWQYRDVRANDEFFMWAGVGKADKFGFELFESWVPEEREINADMLAMLKHYYDEHYYISSHPHARRVYITFTKNAHVHLHRLSQMNASLTNVVVLFFPLGDLIFDPLPEWETYPSSVKAYSELGKLLKACLDFTQLENHQVDHARSTMRQTAQCRP